MKLLKEHGDVKLCDVTIAQAIGGARGVRCLVTDTSYLDPHEGIQSAMTSLACSSVGTSPVMMNHQNDSTDG